MKRARGEMAVLGGCPAFESALHVGRPNIGDRAKLLERIGEALDRRWLTNDGPFVKEFERRIQALLGVRNCIAVCNGTVGLELVARALGLSGEVIVPSYTFIATAHALRWQEIRPVFCDISAGTHNVDPDRVEELIGPRTTGIIATHLWGRAAEVEVLTEIASRRGLKLVFDAAHAFGSTYRGRWIGNYGDAEVLSFHATKSVNTFEGGAVVTNRDDLAEKLRLMRNFGFSGFDNVVHLGTNGKMNEVCAAMGLTSLDAFEDIVEANRRNFTRYRELLARVEGVTLLAYPENESCNYQYVVIEYVPAPDGLSRDELVEVLTAENILARKYFWPGCHRLEPYRTEDPRANERLGKTEEIAGRVVVLPTGTQMSASDIEVVCDVVACAVRWGPEIVREWRR